MIDLKTKIAKLIALEVEIGHFFFSFFATRMPARTASAAPEGAREPPKIPQPPFKTTPAKGPPSVQPRPLQPVTPVSQEPDDPGTSSDTDDSCPTTQELQDVDM